MHIRAILRYFSGHTQYIFVQTFADKAIMELFKKSKVQKSIFLHSYLSFLLSARSSCVTPLLIRQNKVSSTVNENLDNYERNSLYIALKKIYYHVNTQLTFIDSDI